MLKQEYKRLLKNKMTIGIIAALVILALISFVMTYMDKLEWINMYETDFSATLNRDALARFIECFTAMRFMLQYWFNSDFAELTVYLIYIAVGIFVTPIIINQKQTGLGNIIVTRKNYKKYLLSSLGAQTLYLFTVITISVLIELALAVAFGGFGASGSLGKYEFGVGGFTIIVIAQIIELSLHASLANIICSMLSTFINNKYLIQAAPFIIFTALPFLLGQTVANISKAYAKVVVLFDSNNVIDAIDKVANSDNSFNKFLLCMALPIAVYSIIAAVLVFVNIKKNSRDYL